MYENTMMLLEKMKNGEDGSKYFPYSDHTLLNLEESARKQSIQEYISDIR